MRKHSLVPAVLACLALASAFAASEPAATQDGEETQEQADEKEPAESSYEEQVAVTAGVEEVPSAPLGSSSSMIDPVKVIGAPARVTDVVVETASVSENGQGGLFQVYSIRGVSRQRVTGLISDMRISSERRAGVSLSFVDPMLLGPVDVLRGPATTHYGSGALGGVVQIAPRRFDDLAAEIGWGDNGDERYLAVGTGGSRWSVGIAGRKADNMTAPDGTELNTHFSQTSLTARGEWGKGPRTYSMIFIPTYGEDIGKSNTDFPERTTNYPRERHLLLRFATQREGGFSLNAWIHPQDLETEITEQQTQTTVTNQSGDYGARWEQDIETGGSTVQVGAQLFGRRNVNSTEITRDLSSPDPIETLHPLDDGTETELGAYASIGRNWGKLTWEVGARLLGIEQRNAGFENRSRGDWSGYLGGTYPITSSVELRGTLSRGLRFASLSELFFSGTTPRGGVIGNPQLDGEHSLNAELSVRWLGRTVLLTAAVFHNEVSDYIERVEIAPDLLTWINLDSGTIRGAELQGRMTPGTHWRMTFGGHLIDGEASDGRTLADIPPSEAFVGVGWERGRWSARGRFAHRWARTDVGSGEKAIPAAELLSAGLDYRLPGDFRVSLEGTNLLDESFFPSADRKAELAPGRAIFIRLGWSLGG